jgi:hypothetical protein
MFEDYLPGNRTRFVRSFVCQHDDPLEVVILKKRLLLSIGSAKELLIWSQWEHTPLLKLEIDSEPTSAVDLPRDPEFFVLGSVDGLIRIVSVKNGAVAREIDAFGMRLPSPISRMLFIPESCSLVTTNLSGYVKLWSCKDNEIKETRRWKAQELGVGGMTYSAKFNALITQGQEQQIHVWYLGFAFGFIGRVGQLKQWDLNDRRTWFDSRGLRENRNDFKKMAELKRELEAHFFEKEAVRDVVGSPVRDHLVMDGRGEYEEFSFNAVREMLDGIEDQVDSGMMVMRRARRRLGEVPKTVPKKVGLPRDLRRIRPESPGNGGMFLPPLMPDVKRDEDVEDMERKEEVVGGGREHSEG